MPVAVHYDHGLTFERCMQALKLGFTSVMYDGSAKSYDENVAETCEIVKIAHAMDATVEGEIGHVGEAASGDESIRDMYTTPVEAKKFLCATGVDALAVAIGTAHGVYKKKPQLNLDRLKEIRKAVDVPLVLHGGSGLGDDDFRAAIRGGISKVNIFTDLCLAGESAVKDALKTGLDYLETRNLKTDRIRQAVKNKMILFKEV